MKNRLLLLLLSTLALSSFQASGMVEAEESAGKKESEAVDLHKGTSEYTKEKETEASIEESKEQGNPDFGPTGFIERTISEGSQKKGSVNLQGKSEQVEGDIFDLDVLGQRLQEAQAVIAELTGKGPVIEEVALQKLFQEWSERYERYAQAEVCFSKQANNDNIDLTEQKLMESRVQKLTKLVEASKTTVELLENALRNILSDMTRTDSNSLKMLEAIPKAALKGAMQEQENIPIKKELWKLEKEKEKRFLEEETEMLLQQFVQSFGNSFAGSHRKKEKHQNLFDQLKELARRQKEYYQNQSQDVWGKVMQAASEAAKNQEGLKKSSSDKEKKIAAMSIRALWSQFHAGVTLLRGDYEAAELWKESGALFEQARTALDQDEEEKSVQLWKQAAALGGWEQWAGAAYYYSKARIARAGGCAWEMAAKICKQQAAALARGEEAQAEQLEKQAMALGGCVEWPGAGYYYEKAYKARVRNDAFVLKKKEASAWEEAARISTQQAIALERKEEAQAEQLENQAFALGGCSEFPGAGYCYEKAYWEGAKGNLLEKEGKSLWERAAELLKEQAAALQRGAEAQAGELGQQADVLIEKALRSPAPMRLNPVRQKEEFLPFAKIRSSNTESKETSILYPNAKPQKIYLQEAQQPRKLKGGYLYPERGGCIYDGRRYTEHALERMAPNTPDIVGLLLCRAFDRMKAKALKVKKTGMNNKEIENDNIAESWEDYYQTSCYPKPRSILPATVEAEIRFPGSTDLTVKTSEEGDVITVFRKGDAESDLFFNAADIRKNLTDKARFIEYRLSLSGAKQGAQSFRTAERKPQKEKALQKQIDYVQAQRVSLDSDLEYLDSDSEDWENNTKEARRPKKAKKVNIAAPKKKQAALLTQVKGASRIALKIKSTLSKPIQVTPKSEEEVPLKIKMGDGRWFKKGDPVVDSWEELIEDHE